MKSLLFLLMMATTISVFASCNRNDDSVTDNTVQTPDSTNNNTNTMTKMNLKIGNKTFTATFASTVSAEAFKKKLPLTLTMQDYGGFEKVGTLPERLPSDDQRENNLDLGDIMLYGGNALVIFYAPHGGYSYTRIGKIDNTEGLREALGSGSVTVEFSD